MTICSPKQRYFVARGDCATVKYYKEDPSKHTTTPNGAIVVADITNVRHDTKTDSTFFVRTRMGASKKDRIFTLRGASYKEMKEWIDTLRQLKKASEVQQRRRTRGSSSALSFTTSENEATTPNLLSIDRTASMNRRASSHSPVRHYSSMRRSSRQSRLFKKMGNMGTGTLSLPMMNVRGRLISEDKFVPTNVAEVLAFMGKKEGWLFKCGVSNKRFKKRYFRIHWNRHSTPSDPSVICAYYTTNQTKQPRGSIILHGDRTDVDIKDGSHVEFSLLGEHRNLEMRAETKQQRDEWVTFFDTLIAYLDQLATAHIEKESQPVKSIWVNNNRPRLSTSTSIHAPQTNTRLSASQSDPPMQPPPLETLPDHFIHEIRAVRAYLHAALEGDALLRSWKKNGFGKLSARPFLVASADGLISTRFFQMVFPKQLDERALKLPTSAIQELRRQRRRKNKTRVHIDIKQLTRPKSLPVGSPLTLSSTDADQAPLKRDGAGMISRDVASSLDDDEKAQNVLLLLQSCRAVGLEIHPLCTPGRHIRAGIDLESSTSVVRLMWALIEAQVLSQFRPQRSPGLLRVLVSKQSTRWTTERLQEAQRISPTAYMGRIAAMALANRAQDASMNLERKQHSSPKSFDWHRFRPCDFVDSISGLGSLTQSLDGKISDMVERKPKCKPRELAGITQSSLGGQDPVKESQQPMSYTQAHKLALAHLRENTGDQHQRGFMNPDILESSFLAIDKLKSQNLTSESDSKAWTGTLQQCWAIVFAGAAARVVERLQPPLDISHDLYQHLERLEDQMNDRETRIIVNWVNGLIKSANTMDKDSKDTQTTTTHKPARKPPSVTAPLARVRDVDFVSKDGGRTMLRLLEVLGGVGCVDWAKVEIAVTKNPFARGINYGVIVDTVKREPFNLPLQNIGGEDLNKFNRKLTIAFLWQLMRYHLYSFLSSIYGALRKRETASVVRHGDPRTRFSDDSLISWANEVIALAREARGLPDVDMGDGKVNIASRCEIKSLRDKHLSDSCFFMLLVWAIEPSAINWLVVSLSPTDEARINNARYIVSIARRLGALVFMLPEDIAAGRPKNLRIFLGSLIGLIAKS